MAVRLKPGFGIFLLAIATGACLTDARSVLGVSHVSKNLRFHRQPGFKKPNLPIRYFDRSNTFHTSKSTSQSPLELSTSSVLAIRGGGNPVSEAVKGLKQYMKGSKSDTLLLLLTTALNAPICNHLNFSPVLGFLSLGLLMGPNGQGWIKDIHTTELLADIGIVFFLFEMGIHLSFDTLMKMQRDVFGMGGAQFGITAAVVGLVASVVFGLSTEAAIILGGGLALSSSAFVLQLLKDKNQLETKYGKSCFAILLLQDLMVVPLLVITPILAGNGKSVASAFTSAGVQILLALGVIGLFDKFLLGPLYDFVIPKGSQEATIGLCVGVVLAMSFLTEGLGLSNTLGAFLAGVLLAESKHRHVIEKEVGPIRGILVGLFFFTVGFEIDLHLIASKFPLVLMLVTSIVMGKAIIASAAAKAFGLSTPTARHLGLILSQGGEFAFVAFRMARSYGILSESVTKLMLTVVSLTMAVTPALEDLGASTDIPIPSVPPALAKIAPKAGRKRWKFKF